MAEKVEVVIKIPKYYLTHPQDYSCLAECVRRGTSLPKGHGRLKDVDKLDVTTVTTDDYSGNEVLDVVLREDIDDAPTIIEADTESEGK